MLEYLEICLAGEVLDLVRAWSELSVHEDMHGTVVHLGDKRGWRKR